MSTEFSYQAALKSYQSGIRTELPEETLSPDELLRSFHPDYREDTKVSLQIGANRGEQCHRQLAEILQSDALIDEADLAGAHVIETDVLVVGGGGAGCAAALVATDAGARVTLATKLRLGDSNTVMAEGGIQASIEKDDSPQMHYDDTITGGHHMSEKNLVAQMVMDGPDVVRWLVQQGMQFEVNEFGDLLTRRAGGTSASRVMYYRDYTGLEMMRVLREAVLNSNTDVLDYNPVVELLSNEHGHCAGAVLMNLEARSYTLVKARAVIMATGGIGRMHLNGFSTSNHFGATGDGLVLSYRLGAKLRDLDSFQYHPSGLAYPHTMAGNLITEGVRSAGAQLLNGLGKRFVDELKPRDHVSAAIIRECAEGRGVQVNSNAAGVWLDTPTLEQQNPGLIESRFPKLVHLGKRSGYDIKQTPLLIYPTLHYQNGGVVIDENGQTTVPGLYCAGEVSGGIHGRNRIMGNALLEIIHFGRRSGLHAAGCRHKKAHKKVSIEHLNNMRRELTETEMNMDIKGPMLFPDSAHFDFEKMAHTTGIKR